MLDKIRALSRQQGLPLSQIEKAAGLSNGCINKWGAHSPSAAAVKRVAGVLGVSVDYLLRDD